MCLSDKVGVVGRYIMENACIVDNNRNSITNLFAGIPICLRLNAKP